MTDIREANDILWHLDEARKDVVSLLDRNELLAAVIEAVGITVNITDDGITWGDEGGVWGEHYIDAVQTRRVLPAAQESDNFTREQIRDAVGEGQSYCPHGWCGYGPCPECVKQVQTND